MEYYVYILRSARLDRFYIGSTSDSETRIEFHETSPGHKFTGKTADW
ncbi:GIY-YIG nuclease family protein [Salinimicrobium xinjiangense]